MPLTVTAWPYMPDPRSPFFSIRGYAFGQVPPPKFFLKTTGALAPFDNLNDGVLVSLALDLPERTDYESEDSFDCLTKFGFATVQPTPVDHTVRMNLDLARAGPLNNIGDVHLEFPNAIRVWSIATVPDYPPPNRVPNIVTVTPRNFLATE